MLKPKEIAEISLLLWYLPLEKVEEIKKLTLELKNQCGYDEPVDDSDEWTEEDMREARAASLRRWDEREVAESANDD
ncbi:MAG: hypothetical protein ACYC3I_12050 [Gemmataceae bacterium]